MIFDYIVYNQIRCFDLVVSKSIIYGASIEEPKVWFPTTLLMSIFRPPCAIVKWLNVWGRPFLDFIFVEYWIVCAEVFRKIVRKKVLHRSTVKRQNGCHV